MDAGALRETLLLETRSVAYDELGGEVETWATHSTPWAKVMETPGREFLKGDYRAEERTVFVIRYRAIDSTARVTWRGRTYRIDSVTGTLGEGWTYLHCISTEGAN